MHYVRLDILYVLASNRENIGRTWANDKKMKVTEMNHQGISVSFYCVFNSQEFGVLLWRKDFFLSLFAHITKLSSPAGTKSLSAFWSMKPAVSGKSYDPEAY